MLRGVATISFWADDLEAAKRWYVELLGVEPYFQRPGYFEFRLGDLQAELGLIDRRYAPPGAATGPGGAVVYWHVDDLNPELYAYVLEQLLDAGAQDAWLTPIVMKKGRAAVKISVLCSAQRADAIRLVLYREAGTLGVRSAAVEKQALERTTTEVNTRGGVVRVKIGLLDGRPVTVSPEYEDCARAAREAGVPAREIFEEASRLAREEIR